MVGSANARDILLSARLFDADEAYAMGLVNKVVKAVELMDMAREYAQKLARNAPLAVQSAKELALRPIGRSLRSPAVRNRSSR